VRSIRDLDQPELQKLMHSLADGVEERLAMHGFEAAPYAVLPLSDNPVGGYVSNVADRLVLVAWVRETADRIERNEDVPNRPEPGLRTSTSSVEPRARKKNRPPVSVLGS
jgi:hypothetical protein